MKTEEKKTTKVHDWASSDSQVRISILGANKLSQNQKVLVTLHSSSHPVPAPLSREEFMHIFDGPMSDS
jgi:hypothetical protein